MQFHFLRSLSRSLEAFVLPRRAGMSLLEGILATSLMTVMVTVFVVAALGTYSRTESGREYGVATFYATEGMEAVHNIATRGFTNLTDGDHGLNNGANGYSFTGASDTYTSGNVHYTRVITLSTAKRDGNGNLTEDPSGTSDPAVKEILVTITWTAMSNSAHVSYHLRSFISNSQS